VTGEASPPPTTISAVLQASGEVGRALQAVDWPATPLGPIGQWPSSLANVVRLLVTSRFSMWMAWGPELTFFCNDKYRRDTLGKKYPWALGRPASEVWAEIWPEIGPRIEAVMTSGEATWDEHLLLFLERSGFTEETYHTFSYSPLSDEAGRIAGMLCVVTEDTDRIVGERRMATLRELGVVASGIRSEGEFLEATCRQLGANPASLPFTITYLFDDQGDGRATRACSSGISDDHPAAPARVEPGHLATSWPVSEALERRAAIVDLSTERFGELPSGAWGAPPERALVVPILQPGHARPYGFLVVGLNRFRPLDEGYRSFVDLIARHLAGGIAIARGYEAERRRAEQLEELDRAKTAFFSNVSHEFRTPLTLMLGPLQDALAHEDGLDRARLELVHRNALRLLKLVNSLLDFSRAEAGRMRAEFRPTDAAQLTEQLASTFRDATARAGIALDVRCANPSGTAYLDVDLWERIVMNLLSNAFKATLNGGITVTLDSDDGALRLTVADTGSGIPPGEMGELFQRFHRVRTVARSYEGTGIGLALVKELTELHGGEVSARSTVGVGSEFVVSIPLGRGHLPAEHVHEEAVDPAASIAPLFVEEAASWIEPTDGDPAPPGMPPSIRQPPPPPDRGLPRVLIADDTPDLRRYLTRLLAADFDVETVSDGAVAFQVAQDHPPDLVITDVMMPGLDGYALLEKLRGSPVTAELPIIMLSARAGEEAAIEGLRAGADDYLPKPFSGRELLARVRAHVELATVRRQAAAALRTERMRLEQTLQQLPVGVMIEEAATGQITLANRQAAEILGPVLTDAESAAPEAGYRGFALPDGPLPRERWPLTRAIRDTEVVTDEDLIYEVGDRRRRTARVSAAPIRDEHGQVFAGVLVFQDVSERVRSERLIAGQRDILALIANGEPLTRTLDAIVRLVESISQYEARGAIMLLSGDGRRLHDGAGPSLPPAYREAIDGLEVGPEVGSCGTAAFRGETVTVADILNDPLWTGYRELARTHGLRACWSTPIRGDDGRLVGTFAIYSDQPRPPAVEDRDAVELLSQTAAVAIGRARDAEVRARQLHELQGSLLPLELPDVPGLRAAVGFHPGDTVLDVGGDFYDLFALPGGDWGVVIGDVCGHGAEAAAVTALTRHTTRAIARLEPRPARVLEVVNDALRSSDYDRFCTAVYGRLAPRRGGVRIDLACGGHPPPMIRRAAGAIDALGAHGPLLGVFADAVFPETTVDLELDDTLVLYTDGLIERNPRVRGDQGLRSMLASLPLGSVDELLAGLEHRALGDPAQLRDDTAILALQAAGDGPET
jgi:signal transduction histidine kinase/DNA-binding response OmpR family regulator/serine phosphatase RsbU (regulator of sigma subunit)